MDQLRRQKYNELKIEQKDLEHNIEFGRTTISGLKNSSFNQEYILNRIKQIREDKIKYEERLMEVKGQLVKTYAGLNDIEIKQELVDSTKLVKSKDKIANSRKHENKKEKERKKKEMSDFWRNIKKQNKINYQKRRDMKYGYKCYLKAVETLPNYMKRNLKTMPNNKGYIWRGCQFFGERRAERNQPNLIFEKPNRDMLIIHEVTPTQHKIYKKDGKKKRKFISCTPRTSKFLSGQMSDFI